jgi:hypothetical protein
LTVRRPYHRRMPALAIEVDGALGDTPPAVIRTCDELHRASL